MVPRIEVLLCALLVVGCGTEVDEPDALGVSEQAATSGTLTRRSLLTDFENPLTDSFIYQPTNTEWFFSGSGVYARNYQGTAPEGDQVAFVSRGGGVHRIVGLLGGDHVLTLKLKRMPNDQPPNLKLYIAGAPTATFATNNSDEYSSMIALVTGSGNQLLSIWNEGGRALIDDVQLFHITSRQTVLSSGFETPVVDPEIQWTVPTNKELLSIAAGVMRSAQLPDGRWLSAPQGSQFGFMQSGGFFSRVIRLEGGTYSLTYRAGRSAQIGGSMTPKLQIVLGGKVIDSVAPDECTDGLRAYVTGDTFTIPRGNHLLQVLNPTGAALTFIDDLKLTEMC